MAINIPVPISDLPRIGSLYPSYLFVTEKQSITHNISWNKLLGDLTDLPSSIIFGYGSAELPAIGFVDSSAGFYAPQIGAIAVETSNKQRFTIGPSGVIEFGLGGPSVISEDISHTITSESTIKCGVRFNQNIIVDEDVKLSGDLTLYGKIDFEDVVINGQGDGDDLVVNGANISLGGGCDTTTFNCYNTTRSYCGIKSLENFTITYNLVSLSPLNIPNITVTNESSLQKVDTPSNLVVDDGGVVTFNPDGILTITGDVTAGKFFGDGQDITNLNLPSSLRLKGSIDPTTVGPPDPPVDGDVWYSTATGNFTNDWVGVEGDAVRVGQSFYYRAITNSNPTANWVLGGLSDLQSPHFMFIDLDQTVSGSHTHSTIINATDNIDTGSSDIVAQTLILSNKAVSALTISGNVAGTLTTRSYVESRMTNSTLDFPLKVSKYITGQDYNGSSSQTWRLDASPTGNDNIVARNDEGNFSANNITAVFLDGTSADARELDVNYPSVSGDYPVTFTHGIATSQVVHSDTGFTHNPITDTLKVGVIVGDVTGDVTGNADTTTAFETSRDIWGQSFNGTADVSGDMSSVGNIISQSDNTKDIGLSDNVWANIYATTFRGRFEGNVKIGNSTEYTLTNGTHILGGVWNGSVAKTWSIRCDSKNTPEYIVVRDESANFSSNIITGVQFVGPLTGDVTGNITGSSGLVTGNSATFTAFETTRTLWTQPFDGTFDVTGSILSETITPEITSTSDIGSSALPYKDLYVDTIIGDVPNNGTSTDKVNNPLTRGNYWEGTINTWDGSISDTWSVDPRSESVVNKTILRDTNTNFESNVITATFRGPITGNVTGNISGHSGSITGNAGTVTRLETPRTLWSQSFDGTDNVSGDVLGTGNILPTTTDTSGIGREDKNYSDVYATTFHGYFDTTVPEVTQLVKTLTPGPYIEGSPWNGSSELYWNVYARSANTPESVILRDTNENFEAGRITSDLIGFVTGDLTGSVGGSSGSVTGNSATITKFETPREIKVTLSGTYAGSGTIQYDGNTAVEIELESAIDNVDISDLSPLPQ